MTCNYTETPMNGIRFYECLTCRATSVSERSAQLHQEWHDEQERDEDRLREGGAA